ncbi:MAG TPA: isoaspartyl peptidase/L-asparaginase [Chitinophagaceae bacterium]|nr:isoaspartyl peptidase/L-asparaginase [Chitinophagaceae bacterium]
MATITLALHGGAGTILRQDMTPELEQSYLSGLEEALQAGYTVLEKGGTAIDAVKQAVVQLEDNILFNAGRGSVFTKKGIQEMDAAVMDGAGLKAGAVAGVRNVKNPVELALAVMQHSDHVFLSGIGANEFAASMGIKLEPDDYFFSQFRYDQWKSVRESDTYSLDHSRTESDDYLREKKFGTVGAVACDKDGNIAAATSTGGMTNKKFGRIGDSPLIGAGTYANNKTCAISCTGHGEPFIRSVAAYDVSCLIEYKGLSLHDAMNIVVNEKLVSLEGEGGMIGVDAAGNAAMLFNSEGMYRAMKSSNGLKEVSIYKIVAEK